MNLEAMHQLLSEACDLFTNVSNIRRHHWCNEEISAIDKTKQVLNMLKAEMDKDRTRRGSYRVPSQEKKHGHRDPGRLARVRELMSNIDDNPVSHESE